MSLLTKLLALTASAVRAQTVQQCKLDDDGYYHLGEFLNSYIDLPHIVTILKDCNRIVQQANIKIESFIIQ